MKRILSLCLAFIFPLHADLKFEKPLVEIHAPIGAETVTGDFIFKNNGDKTLVIREADAGCSCLVVQVAGGKLSYAPGESGTLRAKFELGSFQGLVDKQINIWLDGDAAAKPSHSVTMRIQIPEIIKISPRTLKWKVGSAPDKQVLEIVMDYNEPIRIESVSSSSEIFDAKLITIEDGKKYEVEVTPKTTATPGLAVLRITTDLKISKHKIQQSFAVIAKAYK